MYNDVVLFYTVDGFFCVRNFSCNILKRCVGSLASFRRHLYSFEESKERINTQLLLYMKFSFFLFLLFLVLF